jgi:2-polyprenyl-3-methyl-5-hydroxy-6-metoxy-1,4-benzoquinol methylase
MIPHGFPQLEKLVAHQLAVFPGHEPFLQKRFSAVSRGDLLFAEEIAGKVIQIAGERLDSVCEDYRWLSETVLDEELHFRRTGRYRLSTFEQADKQVYSNSQLMSRYMNGLLASQLWWRNHTEMLEFFRGDFVNRNPRSFTHLEIGPGHGLFLYFAAASPDCQTAEAWDISDASLGNTRQALSSMHIEEKVSLKKVNLFEAPKVQFDSIAFSEVLEHLEHPREALDILHGLLADDGRIFVNAPINSPAPDHLYLFETPEELLAMIVEAGFIVESSRMVPCTGATLERARKRKLSISVGAIVRKAAPKGGVWKTICRS